MTDNHEQNATDPLDHETVSMDMKRVSGSLNHIGKSIDDRTRQAYSAVFLTEDGRIVLRDLMERGHFFVSSHIDNHPTQTVFREGERHMVLTILAMLGHEAQRAQTISILEEFFDDSRLTRF